MSPLFVLVLVLLVDTLAAQAATVVIDDCTAAPVEVVNRTTRILRPGDDVTLRCALTELEHSKGIVVEAASFTIDGPAGGSIAATGKSLAISLKTTGTITIVNASVDAANTNGDATMVAGDGIDVRAGSALHAGELLALTCTNPGCPITLTAVQAGANRLMVTADGTLTIDPHSVLMTSTPTDMIRLHSLHGDVLAGGGTAGAAPPVGAEVLTGMARAVMLQAAEYCTCDGRGPNQIVTSLEGSLEILAPDGEIDLTAAEVQVGERIDFMALTDVTLTSASIQNCGPKRGKFRVQSASCGVGEATLLDDDPDPAPELACIMSGTPTTLGTCSAQRN
jgi:hypothetical protein